MPASVSGAYYTTVHGGSTGHEYTAEVITSPPNDLRSNMAGLGLAAYVATLGTNPYLYFGLDFDFTNIDYEQFTSALYTYNDYPYYSYYTKWFGFPKTSDPYQYNTLGYVEQKVTSASTAMNTIFGDVEPILDEVRPINYDGVHRYVFETRTGASPQSPLFQPIVLSKPRYDLLNKINAISPGHLGIMVRHRGSSNSLGINPYGLSTAQSLSYGAKIPLAFNKTWGYPITSIKMAIKHGATTIDTITIPSEMYTVTGGDLLFTKTLEEIASESSPYRALLGTDGESLPSGMFYLFDICFQRFVPLTAENEGLALAQVGHYAVMDQMHQYTFAETTSNMIAEMGYTEVLTLLTSIASAPAMLFSTYTSYKGASETAVKSMQSFSEKVFKALFQAFVATPIKESVEELTTDVILEGLIEGYMREWGFSDNLAQWVSLTATSIREGVSLSNRIDSSISSKQESLVEVNEKIADVETELSNIQEAERTQELKEELQSLQGEADTLRQKIDSRTQLAAPLKMISSLMFAGTSLFFGGLSLHGMSSLIGTAYQNYIQEGLYDKVFHNARKRAVSKRLSKTTEHIADIQTKMCEKGLDTETYKSLEAQERELGVKLTNLMGAFKLIMKAEIDNAIDGKVDKQVKSVKNTQQETEMREKLQALTAAAKNIPHDSGSREYERLQEFHTRAYADYALSLAEVQHTENIKIREMIEKTKMNSHELQMNTKERKDLIEGLIVVAKQNIKGVYPIDARFIDPMGIEAIDPNFGVIFESLETRNKMLKPFSGKQDFRKGIYDGEWKTFDTAQMRAQYFAETGEQARIFVKSKNQYKCTVDYKNWLFDQVSALNPLHDEKYYNYIPNYIIGGTTSTVGALVSNLKSKVLKPEYIDREFSLIIYGNEKAIKLYETAHTHTDVNELLDEYGINPATAQFFLKHESDAFYRDIGGVMQVFSDWITAPEHIDPEVGIFAEDDWDGGQSPYHDVIYRFQHELMSLINSLQLKNEHGREILLEGYAFIPGKSSMSREKYLEVFIAPDPNSWRPQTLSSMLSRLKKGEHNGVPYFKPGNTGGGLYKMLARTLINIERGQNSPEKKAFASARVKEFFESYLRAMGCMKGNIYYMEARTIAYISSLLFYDTIDEVERTSLQLKRDPSDPNGIADVIDYQFQTIYDYIDEPGYIPTGKRAQAVKRRINDYLEQHIADLQAASGASSIRTLSAKIAKINEMRDYIVSLLDAYITKAGTRSIVEKIQDTNRESAFGKFLIEFITDENVKGAFSEMTSLSKLSELLFGSNSYLYSTIQADSLPEFSTLWKSVLSSFEWEFELAESNARSAQIGACYREHVQKFLDSNPVSSKVPEGKDYYIINPSLSGGSDRFVLHKDLEVRIDEVETKKQKLAQLLQKALVSTGVSSSSSSGGSLPAFYVSAAIYTPETIRTTQDKIREKLYVLGLDYECGLITREQFDFQSEKCWNTYTLLDEFYDEYGELNHRIAAQDRLEKSYDQNIKKNWYSRDFAWRHETYEYRTKWDYGKNYDELSGLSKATQTNFYKLLWRAVTNPFDYVDAKVRHDWPSSDKIVDTWIASALSYDNNRFAKMKYVSNHIFDTAVKYLEQHHYWQYVDDGASKTTIGNPPEIAKKIAAQLPNVNVKENDLNPNDQEIAIVSHSSTDLALNLLVKKMPEGISHEYPSFEKIDIDGDGPKEQYRVSYAKEDVLFLDDNRFYGCDFKTKLHLSHGSSSVRTAHLINAIPQQLKSSLSQQNVLGDHDDARVFSIIINNGQKNDGNEREMIGFDSQMMYIQWLDILTCLRGTVEVNGRDVSFESDWAEHIQRESQKNPQKQQEYNKYRDNMIDSLPEVYKKFLVDYWEIGDIEQYATQLKNDARTADEEQYWERWIIVAGAVIEGLQNDLINSYS